MISFNEAQILKEIFGTVHARGRGFTTIWKGQVRLNAARNLEQAGLVRIEQSKQYTEAFVVKPANADLAGEEPARDSVAG